MNAKSLQLYRNRPQQQQQQQSSATAAHPQHHYYTTTGSSTVSAGAPYTTRSFPQQRRYGYAEDDHRDYLTPNSAR